jgi:hypothetical protein
MSISKELIISASLGAKMFIEANTDLNKKFPLSYLTQDELQTIHKVLGDIGDDMRDETYLMSDEFHNVASIYLIGCGALIHGKEDAESLSMIITGIYGMGEKYEKYLPDMLKIGGKYIK